MVWSESEMLQVTMKQLFGNYFNATRMGLIVAFEHTTAPASDLVAWDLYKSHLSFINDQDVVVPTGPESLSGAAL